MFCQHCGKEIVDDAVVCVGCGRAVTLLKKVQTNESLGAEKLRQVSKSFLIIGIINILAGILSIMIGWFPGILSIILGIFELIISNRYKSTPPGSNQDMSYIATLEIINVVFGSLWSLFYGISHRNTLNSPEVIAYLKSIGMKRVKGRFRRVLGWIMAVISGLLLVGGFGAYFFPDTDPATSTKQMPLGGLIALIIIFGSLLALSIWMIRKPLIAEDSSHQNN